MATKTDSQVVGTMGLIGWTLWSCWELHGRSRGAVSSRELWGTQGRREQPGVGAQGIQNVGRTSGPHLSDCSNLQLSRSGCVCCADPGHGPSVGAGSEWDTQGSRTRSRVMGTPSVPSPWGPAGL